MGLILKRFENRKPFVAYRQRPSSTANSTKSSSVKASTTTTITKPAPEVARYVPGAPTASQTRRRWKAPWRVALDEAQRLIDEGHTRAAELSLRRALAPGPEPHSPLGAMLRTLDASADAPSSMQIPEAREMHKELIRVFESLVRGYARDHDSRGMVRAHAWLWAMSSSPALMRATAAAATTNSSIAADVNEDMDTSPIAAMVDAPNVPGALSPASMRIMVEFHAQHAEFEAAMRVLRQLRAATLLAARSSPSIGEQGSESNSAFTAAVEALAMAYGKLGLVDKVRLLMGMARGVSLRTTRHEKESESSTSSASVPVPSLGLYHAAMTAHREAGDGTAAVALLRRIMRLRSVPLTSESFNIVLRYYVEQHRFDTQQYPQQQQQQQQQQHHHQRRRGGTGVVFNLLNDMEQAGVSPDATTFELLLQLHSHRGDTRSIARTLHEMKSHRVLATRVGVRAVLALYADQGDLDAVLEVANDMHRSYGLAHSEDVLLYALRATCNSEAMTELRAAIDELHSSNVVAGTRVFDELCAQVLQTDHRWLDEMQAVYLQLRSRAAPCRSSHNAAVALASRHSAELAEAAVVEMAAAGFPADSHTYTRLLEAYLREDKLKAARGVLRRAELAGFAMTEAMLEPLMLYHTNRDDSRSVSHLSHLLEFVGSPSSSSTQSILHSSKQATRYDNSR